MKILIALHVDVANKCAYFGDYLLWPVPHNLINELDENLHMLECKLGINIRSCLQSPFTNLAVATTHTLYL